MAMTDRMFWVIVGAFSAIIIAFIPLAEHLDKAAKLPRAEDVLLVSYPRSGSFWVRFLLANVAYGSHDGFVDFKNIEDIFPDLEYGPNRAIYSGVQPPSDVSASLQRWRPLIRMPKVYKSHQALIKGMGPPCDETISPELERFACECPNCPDRWARVVYIVRDGRDVMCSYYNFQRGLKNEMGNGTFADFLSRDLYPGVSWAAHARSYLEGEGVGPQILWIRYEDLHEKPLETLRRVMAFLDVLVGDALLTRAIEASSFDEMRRTEVDGGLKIFDEHYKDRDESFRVVRKGKTGTWRECFAPNGTVDPALRSRMNAIGLDMLRRFGYVAEEDWE